MKQTLMTHFACQIILFLLFYNEINKTTQILCCLINYFICTYLFIQSVYDALNVSKSKSEVLITQVQHTVMQRPE